MNIPLYKKVLIIMLGTFIVLYFIVIGFTLSLELSKLQVLVGLSAVLAAGSLTLLAGFCIHILDLLSAFKKSIEELKQQMGEQISKTTDGRPIGGEIQTY